MTYSYGFTSTLPNGLGDKFFEISSCYPQLGKYYGLLAGVAYAMPYSLVGLWIGTFAHKINRKFYLAFSVMAGGLS